MTKSCLFFFALAGSLFFTVPLFSQDRGTETPSSVIVAKVVDLSTLRLENGKMIRLIGVDYPEAYLRLEAGQKAMRFLKDLVENRKVHLEFDEKQSQSGLLSAYAFLYLRPTAGSGMIEGSTHLNGSEEIRYIKDSGEWLGVFVNASLLAAGYAYPINDSDIKYSTLFLRLHQEAKDNKRGWWREKHDR